MTSASRSESSLHFIDHFADLAPRYDTLFCDVWGVVHNGVTPFPGASDVLTRFRRSGGTVVLITNAPRPGSVVAAQLDRIGVPRETYDAIVSSGDVTRGVVAERIGQTILHVGPERDLPLFEDLDLVFAPEDRADYCVCTGLFDDTRETPDDYRPMLERMRQRGMLMVCANPDIVVSRGKDLVYCAGALAELYEQLGGEAFYAGKPHRPIYDQAMEAAVAARGRAPERVLAIGDSVRTDFTGARACGLDFLFVVAGIHFEELGGEQADDAAYARIFAETGAQPTGITHQLNW